MGRARRPEIQDERSNFRFSIVITFTFSLTDRPFFFFFFFFLFLGDGDLNSLPKAAIPSPKNVRNLIQEIQGLGKVGIDIFFDTAQCVWPALAPFIDSRSMDAAKQLGLGSNVDGLGGAAGKDAGEMCKLSSALIMIRLDKKLKDFE